MPAVIMRITGGPSRPDRAASAPGTPAEREPGKGAEELRDGRGRNQRRRQGGLGRSILRRYAWPLGSTCSIPAAPATERERGAVLNRTGTPPRPPSTR